VIDRQLSDRGNQAQAPLALRGASPVLPSGTSYLAREWMIWALKPKRALRIWSSRNRRYLEYFEKSAF
jgi:hypothetical protein